MPRMTNKQLRERLAHMRNDYGPFPCLYRHATSGGYYMATGVGIDEATLAYEIRYHPLGDPLVEWHREKGDFELKFERVSEPPLRNAVGFDA